MPKGRIPPSSILGATRLDVGAVPCLPKRRQRELSILYAVVGAERFSFFLFAATLVLFLTEQLGFSAAHAVQTVGYFLCGAYLTPLVGGLLCDGRMGCRRVAILGSALQVAGYAAFLFQRLAAIPLALSLLAIGSGFFKAGTQTVMGGLYPASDPRRERSFSTLYLVINVMALAAPLLAGIVRHRAGWSGLYLSACLGAVVSTLLQISSRQSHADRHLVPCKSPQPRNDFSAVHSYSRLALTLLAGAVFTAGGMQSHSSLLLWARDRTQRHVGTFEIPTAWFAAAPAALVLVVAPLLAGMFAALQRRGCAPSTFQKIILGLMLSCLAAVPMWAASLLASNGQRTSPFWVLGCLTILAISELLVIALGPSEISRLSPPHKQGRWLSYWFVSQAIGNLLGGVVHH